MDDPIDKIERQTDRQTECEFLRPKLFSKIYNKLGTWKLYLREAFSKFYDKTLVENLVAKILVENLVARKTLVENLSAKTLVENLVAKTLVQNLFAMILVLEPWIACCPSLFWMSGDRFANFTREREQGWVAFAKIRSIFFFEAAIQKPI